MTPAYNTMIFILWECDMGRFFSMGQGHLGLLIFQQTQAVHKMNDTAANDARELISGSVGYSNTSYVVIMLRRSDILARSCDDGI